MSRQQLLENIIHQTFNGEPFTLEFAAADADFRRYFRALFDHGRTLIVMDAPPEKMSIQPFLTVHALFSAVKLPEIYYANRDLGVILMEDLGRYTFLDAMRQDEREIVHKTLLLEAVDTLIALQKSTQANRLPSYDTALLTQEINLFCDWYLPYECQTTLSDADKQAWQDATTPLIEHLTRLPKVYVHRDFMGRNLMLRHGRPGVLDFQDAREGMITYDLASLMRDAFISWDEEFTLDIVIRYWEKARAAGLPVAADFDGFYRDFEFTATQRHLKVIGIFSRLKHRDAKAQYANDIPRFIRYLRAETRRYHELHPLYAWLNRYFGTDDNVRHGFTF